MNTQEVDDFFAAETTPERKNLYLFCVILRASIKRVLGGLA